MKEIILAVWLGIQGGIDWKYKEIPSWLLIVGGLIGMVFCCLEKRELGELLISCLPGGIALIISRLTREMIGYGDGIVFVVLGLFLPLEKVISIGMLAFILAGVVALVLLAVFRKNGKYRLPFLPFLAFGYYMSLI